MRKDKITDHACPSFDLSLSFSEKETSIEIYLLNLFLGVLLINHELLNERIDSFELDFWFSF